MIGSTRRRFRQRGRPAHPDVLTPVEWAVLLHVRRGLSNSEIAQIRGCRTDTVKYHVANIVAKLQLTDRDALRRWAGAPVTGEPLPGIDLQTWERRNSMPRTTTARTTLTGVAPMFLVDDVARTAEWYRDTLGFEIGEYFREEHDHDHDEHGNDIPREGQAAATLGVPVFVILHRDGQRLMLGKTTAPGHGVRSNRDYKHYSSDAYFWADDIQPLYQHAKSTGATIVTEPEMQPYGLREFLIKDYDGRIITFGSPA